MIDQSTILSILEDIGLVFNAPPSLLRGRGGVRNAEVALARKISYWVLSRRGVPLSQLCRLFSRKWTVILKDLRWADHVLTGASHPAWAIDIYPLAHTTLGDLLHWALKKSPLAIVTGVWAYCQGVLLARPGLSSVLQLQGLKILALQKELRANILWAFEMMQDRLLEGSIQWQARKMGYTYIP